MTSIDVYQMLANYQCGVDGSENGDNGFLRMVILDEYLHAPDHEFAFDNVDFSNTK